MRDFQGDNISTHETLAHKATAKPQTKAMLSHLTALCDEVAVDPILALKAAVKCEVSF
jgi:hypothetical protein